MKIWVLLFAFLGCVLIASCGDWSSSSSESDESSTSEDTSESRSNLRWAGSRFRSASCSLRPSNNSTVHGYLHIYQKNTGQPVWIKGGVRGLGPTGTQYSFDFHRGYPSIGECDRAGEKLENVGGTFAQVTAKGNNSGDGIKRSSTSISVEEGPSNSVIGKSIVVTDLSSGKRVACCGIERTRERVNY